MCSYVFVPFFTNRNAASNFSALVIRNLSLTFTRSLDAFRLEVERITRPKIKPHIVMCIWIVPNSTLISHITDQIANIASAFNFARFYDLDGDLKLAGMK
jgi:hypothetical protein